MNPFVLETSFGPAPASQVDSSGSTTLLETNCSSLWWGGVGWGGVGGGGGQGPGIVKYFKIVEIVDC